MAAPTLPVRLVGRYEIKQVLGQGGMGLVYRAYDAVIKRDVALKTLRDVPEPAALQLFYKECGVLASMTHPNIVEIFDMGELEEEGKRKPYFVMPLLPGTTLDNLIRNSSHRLTVERIVGIISQTCRGLQAAHERGLVHRDLKPSNIFVMDDDSVKIIDFGVAHIADVRSTMGLKGTLLYMSPEQIEMKPLSGLSDVFSLAVVCYEALTGRHPFHCTKQEEIVDAILHRIPPPASELNSNASQAISRVVHKAMAKQPWHRFASAREFGDTLNKALRNEPIELFDPARLRPRLERAAKALEQGDYQFAGELLGELEAEGHLDTSIGLLRQQLDKAVRQKTVAQLLASAKARFEEDEDPLALQKIQEVLQLEPDNAAALLLRSNIEQRRSERQIESWYRLAHQHIENHSYTHAREALQNVLQLRPHESNALQMLEEIKRQEQEYNKLLQEKAQLHRAAMEAWQKGEVSSALTKLVLVLELDRRAPDSSSPERSATYQSFYNEVRCEHDAMNNAYAEARTLLGDHNFDKALAVCGNYLAKYPTNALFQALKFDIEEQRRQELSAFIAAVDRQVEAEPDLNKRVNILKEALTQHPGEAHFESALRLMQDKRDLVDSIVARAHVHEEQAAFGDALGDWEILRTIYGQYPGLKFEIERLQKRREQQSRLEAKARRVEQIDACLRSSDCSRALSLLQEAQAEFPGDAELAELEKLVQEALHRAAEAQRLMTEGQALCAQRRFEEGTKLLRQAYELDERNAVARAVLADVLVEQAQLLLESDWSAAEILVEQALDLNPLHGQAKSLRTLVLDRKREQFVNDAVSQARRLQAAADLEGALAHMDQSLTAYPNDARLIQVRDTLQKEVSETQLRQDRRRDLDELKQLGREVEKALDGAATQTLSERTQALARKYSEDQEFQFIAGEIGQRLQASIVQKQRPAEIAAELPVPGATMFFSPEKAGQETPSIPSPVGAGLPPPAAGKGATALLPKSPTTRAMAIAAAASVAVTRWLSRSRSLLPRLPAKTVAMVAGSLVLLAIVTWVTVKAIHRHLATPPAVVQLPLRVRTLPAGATIRINGEVKGLSDLELSLPPGTYQIEAILDGYQPSSSPYEAKAGAPSAVEFTLQPAFPLVKLTVDTSGGRVWLDDQPAVELEGAQWSADKLTPGEHTLKFGAGDSVASLAFTLEAGSLPLVKGPVSATGLHALVLSNWGDQLRVYCGNCPKRVSFDDRSSVEMRADGVDVTDVTPGPHKLTLSQGSDRHTVDFEVGPLATLSAFLLSDQNVGALLVVAGVDRAQIFLNGRAYKSTDQSGQLLITNLPPKEYAVRAVRSGYQEVPEQHVAVRKGEQTRLTFKMVPVPRLAYLSIQNGTPGAEVLLDQAAVGTIQPDGTLRFESVSPGEHSIELRKDRFRPKRLRKQFVAGSTVALSGAEASLEAAMGELRITFSPADAEVTLTKAGEAPIKVTSGSALSLPPGSYALSARTATLTRSAVVEVAAGETRNVELSLTPGGMSGWEGSGWKRDKGGYVRKGGDFVLYGTSPSSGTFIFSALLLKGPRLRWVLNFINSENYALFVMDENSFYRSQVRNGQSSEVVRIPYKTDKRKYRTFQIRVSANQITHEIREGEAWVPLDSWTQPDGNLSAGKFGFYIPGNDEVVLSNFSHYGDLKTH